MIYCQTNVIMPPSLPLKKLIKPEDFRIYSESEDHNAASSPSVQANDFTKYMRPKNIYLRGDFFSCLRVS